MKFIPNVASLFLKGNSCFPNVPVVLWTQWFLYETKWIQMSSFNSLQKQISQMFCNSLLLDKCYIADYSRCYAKGSLSAAICLFIFFSGWGIALWTPSHKGEQQSGKKDIWYNTSLTEKEIGFYLLQRRSQILLLNGLKYTYLIRCEPPNRKNFNPGPATNAQ